MAVKRDRRPRIGINAHLLNLSGTYRSAGISGYIFHLLRHLADAAPDLDLDVYTGESSAPEISRVLRWHISRLSTRSPFVRIFWEQCIAPWHALSDRLDLVHSLAFVQPLALRTPSIVTVYDLSFLLYPELFRPLNRLYLRWGTRASVRRAGRVIAISENTRRDLIQTFGLPAERVQAIPCGVEERFFSDGPVDPEWRAHWPARFVLYLGTLEPRKNVARLVRAFAKVKSRTNLPHTLVLAGARGWLDQDVDQAIRASGLRDEIILPGFVPSADLPALYRSADLFTYPSLYEGFGLPPLEALASGTPVIVSNASSLPEVVGEAGICVDPLDENALADSIELVLTNPVRRREMAEAGRARARSFSWSSAAQATARIYRDMLNLN